MSPTKENYDDIKIKLRSWDKVQKLFDNWHTDHYKENPISLTDFEGAAYYWFNHNLSYGPMFLGWLSSVYTQEKKYKGLLKKVKEFKINNLSVQQASFEDAIPQHANDLIYLDPPYYLEKDGDNKMFKGIYPNPNFDLHHSGFNHEKLRDLLHSHKGNFVLSYNNCETIRNWYKDFDISYPQWNYSMGQGETRIGKNKIDNSPKASHEILIMKK
jgi:DNA adenine methylase